MASHRMNVYSSILTSTLRAWRGSMQRAKVEAVPRLELFDMENCPFCRLAREAISELQIDVDILPCPKGGTRFRPRAEALVGGKTTYPTLHNVASGEVIVGSREIVEYLRERYAPGRVRAPGLLAKGTSALASLPRAGRGTRVRPSREPEKLLELYSFESSPFSRLVREVMTELELPYTLRSLAKEQVSDIGMPGARLTFGKEYEPIPGSRREALRERGGKIQVPFLIDPNTGAELYESKAIVRYLEETYAL